MNKPIQLDLFEKSFVDWKKVPPECNFVCTNLHGPFVFGIDLRGRVTQRDGGWAQEEGNGWRFPNRSEVERFLIGKLPDLYAEQWEMRPGTKNLTVVIRSIPGQLSPRRDWSEHTSDDEDDEWYDDNEDEEDE